MSWGYIPNLHIILLGDKYLAGGYVPFGVEVVRKLMRSGLQATQKNLATENARIHAKIVGDQRWLTIEAVTPCELYLESGFVDVNVIARSAPERFEPGRIRHGALILSDHLYGAVNPAVGAASSAASHPASGEYSERSFFYRPKEEGAAYYPQSDALWMKKVAAHEVPASLYSGKMRLFVQAKYGGSLLRKSNGSELFDWEPMCRVKEFNWATQPFFSVGDLSLMNESTLTTGLFTDENDGSYWLIQATSVLTVHCVELTTCGLAMYRQMKAEEERRSRRGEPFTRADKAEYEAYILADAKISKDFKFTLHNLPAINPLAYGWKFNWSGSRATCISLSQQGTGNNTYFRASRQDFTLTRNYAADVSGIEDPVLKEKAKWSMTTSNQENVGEFNFTFALASLWSPSWFDYLQTLRSGINVDQVPKPGSGPVYCWYDADDELVLINYSLTSDSGVTKSYDKPPHMAYGGYDWYFKGQNGNTEEYNYGSLSVQAFSCSIGEGVETIGASGTRTAFSIDIPSDGMTEATGSVSLGFTALATPADHPLLAAVNAERQALNDVYAQHLTNTATYGENTDGLYVTRYWDVAYGEFTYTTYPGYSRFGHSALVVPFYDCEACYMFSYSGESATERATVTYGNNVRMNPRFECRYGTPYDPVYINYGPVDAFIGWQSPGPQVTASSTDSGWTSIGAPTGILINKHDTYEALPSDLGQILSPSVSYPYSNKLCRTFTPAMNAEIAGDAVSPTHANFDYTVGSFIGWM